MHKSFQRALDNKFLVSLDENIWSDIKSDAKKYQFNNYKEIWIQLLNNYQEKDIITYTDYSFKSID